MIRRSDHSTAEISHILNKWYLGVKLFNNTDLKVKKVEIDFSRALIHRTCSTFNKFTILSYLLKCWEFIHNVNLIEPIDLMHRISHNLERKCKIENS